MEGSSEVFTLGLLKSALDLSVTRHRAISQNVANVNTPGYKRFSVEFSNSLNLTMGDGFRMTRTHPAHMAEGGAEWPKPVVKMDDMIGRNDGNNVDIDVEMAMLAENAIWYQALARQVDEVLARWRLAISEGRR